VIVPPGAPALLDALATVAVSVTACPRLAGFAEEVTVTVVPDAPTTWLSTAELVAPKLPVPAYTAVIASVPTGSPEVVKVAVLLTAPEVLSVAVPSAVVPFINTTEPVGGAKLLVSVAVSVTAWPTLAGLGEEVTAAVLPAVFTTSFSAFEVDGPKLAVPAYTAVIASVPAPSVEVVSVAVLLNPPLAASVALPSSVVPFINATDPVGTAVLPVIVAVSPNDWPAIAGLKAEATVAVVVAAPTTWLNTPEIVGPKLPAPGYAAVMESLPTGRVNVVIEAVLLVPLPVVSVTVPIAVVPFIKVTEPVGAPKLLETVAVSVTAWPMLEGLSEDASVAVVLAALITWLNAAEVAAPKLPDPAYTAVMESAPTASVAVVRLAVLLEAPLAARFAVPITVAPLINVTDPVGAVEPLDTVAVSVTDCPTLDGFSEELTVAVVPAAFTTSFRTAEVAAPKLPDPA
jgi:hypothetical protein